ncbi:MAG: glycosyltransferase family 2 protein [Nitrospiria bacterium]
MTEPLVSVVILTLNSASTLARTIDSVKAQTYENWEIVIVDRGSTDTTDHVYHHYQDRDRKDTKINRFWMTREPGISIAQARNIANLRAQGEGVVELRSGRVLPPNFLEKYIQK